MKYVITIFLFLTLGMNAMATDTTEKSNNFEPDKNIQKVAEAYSLDAIDFLNEKFNIKLDWSDSSIIHIETALEALHQNYNKQNPKPTEDQVMVFAKMFGSYIGEVYRKNHGAKWGIVTLVGEKYPGLQSTSGGTFWPWGRALNRITVGSENNVKHYYDLLLEKGT